MTPDEKNLADRLQELLQSQLEGRSNADEKRELSEILRDHPWTQELYVEFIQDTASLRWWSANVPLETAGHELMPAARQLAATRRLKSSVRLMAAVAAAVLVLLGAAAISHFRRPAITAEITKPAVSNVASSARANNSSESAPKALPPANVATVTRLRSVEWSGKETVAEMSRLAVGQTLQLTRGELEIYFDQAVQLVVRGPAKVQIRSPQEVYGYSGTLAARVGKAGIGFTIITPAGRITDQGTEFGVAIGDKGATDVAVFRGAVDLTYGSPTNKLEPSVVRRLVRGQALRLDSDGNMQRLMAIENTQFPSVDAESKSAGALHRPIITDVRDNIREGVDAKFYRIVPSGLDEDVDAYVDREHQWNGVDKSGIPPLLVGADYVMPFNGDKVLSQLNVALTISQPAVLYIFLSDIAKVPEWLEKDFVKTDLRIGLDESSEFSNPRYRLQKGPGNGINTQFSIWSREIPAPTTITLGSIEQGKKNFWGFCMYGIAAVPLEKARAMEQQESPQSPPPQSK